MHFVALLKFLIKSFHKTWQDLWKSESWLVEKWKLTIAVTELGRESQLCLISLELLEIPMHWLQIQHLPNQPPAFSYNIPPAKSPIFSSHNLRVIQNVSLGCTFQIKIYISVIHIFCLPVQVRNLNFLKYHPLSISTHPTPRIALSVSPSPPSHRFYPI